MEGSEFCGGADCDATIENDAIAALPDGLLTSRRAVPGCADSLTLTCTSSCVSLICFQESMWIAFEAEDAVAPAEKLLPVMVMVRWAPGIA